ncbi:MAG: hypothetical protein QCH31_11060 [Methanolobus sp.]|nr:hypothetical protein [Methanolobus sp.]
MDKLSHISYTEIFRRHRLNNITRFVIISLIALVVVVLAAFLLANLYFSVGTVEKGSEQVAGISGEYHDDDLLIARSHSYKDLLVFTYVPRSPQEQIDLYADYELKEDGNVITAGNNRPYENISVDNPIIIEIPRNNSSAYELDISIKDTEGKRVHKSSITIWPQENDN